MILEIQDFSAVSDENLALIQHHLLYDGYVGLGYTGTEPFGVSKQDLWNWVSDLQNKYGGKQLSVIHGIIKNYGIGQAPFMWKARDLLYPLFQQLWLKQHGESKLVVSFDGANIATSKSRVKPESWLHRDQRPECNNFQMYQGVLQLNKSGGLVVCPRSHWESFEGVKTGKDWFRMPEELKEVYEAKRCTSDYDTTLWLWDSRVFHANYPPTVGEEQRAALYITFGPRPKKNWDWKQIDKRVQFVKEGVTTSHWPHKLAKNPAPRFYNLGDNYLPKDALGEIIEVEKVQNKKYFW